jgi:hypothetical protein
MTKPNVERRCNEILRILNKQPNTLKKISDEYLSVDKNKNDEGITGKVDYKKFIDIMNILRYSLMLLVKKGKVEIEITEAQRSPYDKKLYKVVK